MGMCQGKRNPQGNLTVNLRITLRGLAYAATRGEHKQAKPPHFLCAII
jgi:hypothetical protein